LKTKHEQHFVILKHDCVYSNASHWNDK